ncbi:MAG: threonine synthase, partial [Angelakisella sp.]
GKSDSVLCGLMQELAATGSFTLPPQAQESLANDFWGGFCDDGATRGTIAEIFGEYSYLCDPHTAVAANVAGQYRAATGDDTPMVIVSTASPYKFADSVLDALGAKETDCDDFRKAEQLERITGTAIPRPISSLATAERRFSQVCGVEGMACALKSFLKL